ncbi:MAG: cyanophycinase [Bacteroidales bacterium]|nr:cyanophycinase [Bacteroidales bacterium]
MERIKLILIGGAEDKTDRLEVLSKVAECANFKNLVLIPTASQYPHEIESQYKEAFRKLNVENFTCLDIRYEDECDKEEHITAIQEANLVFFSGGDQVKLVSTIKNSQLYRYIMKRYAENSLTIAGTSAGAAAASENMLFDGDYQGFLKGKVRHMKGFGFIDDVVIDTHFLNRERIPRLMQMLALGVETKAIGLDEDTAILIDIHRRFEVVGSGMVTLLNSEEMTYNDYHEISENQTININNLKLGFLSRGSKFDISNWCVTSPQTSVTNSIFDPQLIAPGAYI